MGDSVVGVTIIILMIFSLAVWVLSISATNSTVTPDFR